MNSAHRTLIISALLATSIVLFFPKSTSQGVRGIASVKPVLDLECVRSNLRDPEATAFFTPEAIKRFELLEEIAKQPLNTFITMSGTKKITFKDQIVTRKFISEAEEKNLKTSVGRFLSSLNDSVKDIHSSLKQREIPIPPEAQLFEGQVEDALKALTSKKGWVDSELANLARTRSIDNSNVADVGKALLDRVLDENGKYILEGTRLERLRNFSKRLFKSRWGKFLSEKMPEFYVKNAIFFGSVVAVRYYAPTVARKFQSVSDPQSELVTKSKEFWTAQHSSNVPKYRNKDEATRIHKAWESVEASLGKIVKGEWSDTSGELTLKLQQLGSEFRDLYPDLRLFEPFAQTEKSRVYVLRAKAADFVEKEAALRALLNTQRTDALYLTALDLAKQEFAHAAAVRFLSLLFETRQYKDTALQEARQVHDSAINLVKDPKLLYSALYLQSKLSRKDWKARFDDLDELAGE